MPLRNSLRAPGFGQRVGQREREIDQTAKERQALDQLFSLAYEELRRLASSVKRGDPSNTLSATALVNEAWLKLAKQPGIAAATLINGAVMGKSSSFLSTILSTAQ